MKCSNCGIEIKSEFSYAISANKCPACGKTIIPGAGLGAYLDIKKLLDEKFKTLTELSLTEDIALLIVSNFNVRKLGEVKEEPKEIKTENNPEETKVVMPDGIVLEKFDKGQLKKMREEALKDAISDRYDVELSDDVVIPEIDSVAEEANKVKQEQKRENILTGAKGVFRRS